ncbi:MAG: ArsA family ATPase [Miltoncostaeaceae bacterium]
MPPDVDLMAMLRGRRVVVVAGAGGVGKTTVSAALGLGLAAAGARVAVVTIDPARRLATALGIPGLGDEPHRVDPAVVEAAGMRMAGTLDALQLDPRATFDRLIAREAPDDAARDRILRNRVYRHLSGAAGAQEFMAVERLHELVDSGAYDVVVLDTPPARNALDFLDAPERMTRFVEGRGLRLLLGPRAGAGRTGWRALQAGGHMVMSVVERLTGAQLLTDISEFLQSFDGMYQGFSNRAAAVHDLVASDSTRFVVVTGPRPEPASEAVALWRRLADEDYPLGAVVVNRVHPEPGATGRPDGLAGLLRQAGAPDPEGLASRAEAALEAARSRAAADAHEVGALSHALSVPPLAIVPALAEDPVEVAGLAQVTRALGGDARGPGRDAGAAPPPDQARRQTT